MADEQTFGEHLRSRRWEELWLFQEDVARAARISIGLLSEIESDRTRTSEPTLRRLAVALTLDPDEVVAHARCECRLGKRSRLTKREEPETVVPPVRRAEPPSPLPDPDFMWLTADEAAAAIGITSGSVRHLMRVGVLAPTKRLRLAGRGHLRWFVSRDAVLTYVPANDGRAFPHGPRQDPPPGYLSMNTYAEVAGVPKTTLWRRLNASAIESIVIDGR